LDVGELEVVTAGLEVGELQEPNTSNAAKARPRTMPVKRVGPAFGYLRSGQTGRVKWNDSMRIRLSKYSRWASMRSAPNPESR